MPDPKCSLKFTFEPGWFVDYPVVSHSPSGSKLTTQSNLGLLSDREWAGLTEHVEQLNHQEGSDFSHKILLVARHGHGVHNDVMEEVGSEEWKNHWSKLPGDGNRIWLDAELVEKGIQQAKDLGKLYTEGIRQAGFPVPDTIYTSPLIRTMSWNPASPKKIYYGTLIDQSRMKHMLPVHKNSLRMYGDMTRDPVLL